MGDSRIDRVHAPRPPATGSNLAQPLPNDRSGGPDVRWLAALNEAGAGRDTPVATSSALAHAVSRTQRSVSQDFVSTRNVKDLARLITTEAGGEGAAAMRAVGWTVRNRMVRDHTTQVDHAWRGYQHRRPATPGAFRIAREILAGATLDPTGGATHFYTPKAMPKRGDDRHGIDAGGGLEHVPGVVRHGKAIENYRPSWAATFEAMPVPGVSHAAFKFYRQPGSGTVR